MLILGPIVGHTTDTGSRIWIQVEGDPADWAVRIPGADDVRFAPTERDDPEFGTAIAELHRLAADTLYRYEIVRRDDPGRAAAGSFRTMPGADCTDGLSFVSASCDSLQVAGDSPRRGAWDALEACIGTEAPRFLMLLGDQVYLDVEAGTWELPLDIDRRERRRRMAEAYRRYWSREPVARILANLPSYMMWDDHDIRNGWGSSPGDSPRLAARHPKGRAIAARYQAYFEDARQVYWHFQHVRNPPTPGLDADGFLAPGTRRAAPFQFRAGGLTVLVLDNRGARDQWRKPHPALGAEQWAMLRAVCRGLDPGVRNLAVIVPLPVLSMANHGPVQIFLGHRSDDVGLFAEGDEAGLRRFGRDRPTTWLQRAFVYLHAIVDFCCAKFFGWCGTGSFLLSDVTDVRDNWANHRVRGERNALLREVLRARTANRPPGAPRAVTFIGGDLHIGALIDLVVPDGPVVPTMIASGVGQSPTREPVVGFVVQRAFRVSRGLRAVLRQCCVTHNFGLTRVRPAADPPGFAHEIRTDGTPSPG